MGKNKSLPRLAALASSALLLASCSAWRAAENLPAPLAVDLSTVCEEVLEHVDLPPRPGPDDDAIDALVEHRGVAKVATARVDAGRECIRDQRELYAGKEGN